MNAAEALVDIFPLLCEHLALGAQFSLQGESEALAEAELEAEIQSFVDADSQEELVPLNVLSYPTEHVSQDESTPTAQLMDLSAQVYLLISGDDAVPFMDTVFAGKHLEPGECAWSPMLAQDGSLISSCFVVRAGSQDYVVLDFSPRQESSLAWLNFITTQLDLNVTITQAWPLLYPLSVEGSAAREVLSDYLERDEALPEAGQVKQINLDGTIPTIIANMATTEDPHYLLLVRPSRVRVLFRSLLSFQQINPRGSHYLETQTPIRLTDDITPTQPEFPVDIIDLAKPAIGVREVRKVIE